MADIKKNMGGADAGASARREHHYAGGYVAPADSLFEQAKTATIGDLMDKQPYAVRDTATMMEVADQMIRLKVSSLPVVDEDGRVVGFISDGDIMHALSSFEPRSIFTGGTDSMVFFDDETTDEKIGRLKNRNVMELATRRVVAARAEQTIGQIARTLSNKRFKKLPVVDGQGRLIGVIRRKSIVKFAFNVMFHNELPESGVEAAANER